jgi:hypothetical protein
MKGMDVTRMMRKTAADRNGLILLAQGSWKTMIVADQQ